MKVIAYLRVSADKQAERSYGLEDQRKDVRAVARAIGYRIVRTEVDPGLSGTLPDEERPILLAALKAIRDDEADGLLIPDLSRLSRYLHVQEAILAKVWQMGGKTFSARDYHGEVPRDDPDDPKRTAIRQMAGVLNQLDRALIIKRMRNRHATKAAKGGFAYGSPAYGQRSENRELVPDEAEAAVVARILARHDERASSRQIAAELNAEGVPAKRGGKWQSQTVLRVIYRANSRACEAKPDLTRKPIPGAP
jgi:DNA invertase Pin-like site-specific DNA recombinase